MKRMLAAVITIVAASSFAFAQRSAPSSELEVQEVQQANKEFWQAYGQKNAVSLDQRVAERAIFIGSKNDAVVSKADLKAAFSPGARPINIKNIKVVGTTVHGETAVVVGRLWVFGQQENNTRVAFTNVFVKSDKGWRLIASTVTQLS